MDCSRISGLPPSIAAPARKSARSAPIDAGQYQAATVVVFLPPDSSRWRLSAVNCFLRPASDAQHLLWRDGMTIGKGKRPRDSDQLANWTVDVSTGQIPAPQEANRPEVPASDSSRLTPALSEYTVAIGRKGGQIIGKPRLKTMTKEQPISVLSRPDPCLLCGPFSVTIPQ